MGKRKVSVNGEVESTHGTGGTAIETGLSFGGLINA